MNMEADIRCCTLYIDALVHNEDVAHELYPIPLNDVVLQIIRMFG
jgi:hypothetical protein